MDDSPTEPVANSETIGTADAGPVPELYFGLVRAIGTPLKPIVDALNAALKSANFSQHPIKLSACLEEVPDCKF